MNLTERDFRKCSLVLLTAMGMTFIVLTVVTKTRRYDIPFETEEFYHMLECEKLRGSVVDTSIVNNVVLASDNSTAYSITYRPILNCMDADDEYLVDAVKKDYIKDYKGGEYNLTLPKDFYSMYGLQQTNDVYSMVFKDLKNGFFIEAGEHTCSPSSVTLPFELNLNWTGLLVEPAFQQYARCVNTNRRVKLMNSCLSHKTHPHYSHYETAMPRPIHLFAENEDLVLGPGISVNRSATSSQMQCFPLYSAILAMGNPKVNLLVLDLEGLDYLVLKTIPWTDVDIEVVSVETKLAGKVLDGSPEALAELMTKAGYTKFKHTDDMSVDKLKNMNEMFVRNDIVKKYSVQSKAK